MLETHGKEELALVHVAQMRDEEGYLVEFAESLQPPHPREEKWVLIVSSLFGCPIKCRMCDACTDYLGRLEPEELLEQIDFMISSRFPDGKVPIPKLKVQFARMGEPALNLAVLDVLEALPDHVNAPGLMPSLSTIAPVGTDDFFEGLIRIKNDVYTQGRFQFQFSIHTTDQDLRDQLMSPDKQDDLPFRPVSDAVHIPEDHFDENDLSDEPEQLDSHPEQKICLEGHFANHRVAEHYGIDLSVAAQSWKH